VCTGWALVGRIRLGNAARTVGGGDRDLDRDRLGDRDANIPVSHAYAGHDAIAGSRLVIIEGVGHFPQIGAPEQFVEALDDFIDSTAPARLGTETAAGCFESDRSWSSRRSSSSAPRAGSP
jgi:hypothetical protein